VIRGAGGVGLAKCYVRKRLVAPGTFMYIFK